MHDTIIKGTIVAGEKRVHANDFIVFAVVNRSLALIDGFVTMVERRNKLAGMPMVRMQLDNALRFFARQLAKDEETVARQLVEGKPLNKIALTELTTAEKLTDSFLHKQVSAEYDLEVVSRIYEEYCAYVHLSDMHMIAPITEKLPNGDMGVRIEPWGSVWTDDEIKKAIQDFRIATNLLLFLCGQWIFEKDKQKSSS